MSARDKLDILPELLRILRQPLGPRMLRQLRRTMEGFRYAKRFTPGPANPSPVSTSEEKEVNELKAYFDAHQEGRGIWKWNHYFEIYDRHFRRFVGQEVHLAEIGVYSGGSLEMWRDYFGPECRLYGIDIESSCKVYENDHTRLFIGDQADRNFWSTFRREVPVLDIIIDDGGHYADQQIPTLEELLPHLRPGGIYLCEDVHGLHNAFSAYARGLADNLNAMRGNALSGVHPTPFQSWIRSIHFYPYVVVIEKADRPVERLTAPKHGSEWQPFDLAHKKSSA